MKATVYARLRRASLLVLACFAMTGTVPAAAEIETIDPSVAYDDDLAPQQPVTEYGAEPAAELPPAPYQVASADGDYGYQPGNPAPAVDSEPAPASPPAAVGSGDTYQQDDLVGAAEGVFGKGAEGLAGVIEDILAKQGEPNGYIVGREGGGAFIFGARYGSGTLYHKVEGTQPVYWRGPSLGIDAGANAASTFVLVYNLYDSEDLFKTYGQGEGQAYFIGGFNVSYLRRGDVVLVPVRVGAGLRLGLNVGYMKFSHEQKWLPF